MGVFESPDLVPLWDRPPDFMPLHPHGGAYRWRYDTVRRELVAVSETLDKASSERRVALLAHPDLSDCQAAEGLHAGIQLLRAGEAAAAHRHTPAALRVGLEATELITTVNDDDLLLDPLDVVLNPSGTWHGHEERGGAGAVWLDVVDLPLVAALGGVLFEPAGQPRGSDLLDPPIPVSSMIRFAWSDVEPELGEARDVSGVRSYRYGDGSVLPTLAVTAHAVDEGATLHLPARTAGAVALIGRGRFELGALDLDRFDVISLRSWTPASFTSRTGSGVVMVIDTSPVAQRLGLYREAAQR
ncbi:MAG: cupin domain-containing protein [Acidimicrobiia bacterium]|nr:cupin domain-containing protein [Acidimicrobiia bacterium]